MGRGRAKAKQTKVARQLKYHSDGTDLDRLRAELSGNGDGPMPEHAPAPAVDEAEYDDLDGEDDEDARAT